MIRKKQNLEHGNENVGAIASPGGITQPLAVAFQIGKRIAEVRGHRTQGEFAGSIDIHKNTLGKYERGERLPDAWVILQMMKMHKVNPAWLMTGVGEPYSNERPAVAPPFLPFIPELFTALMQAVEDALRESEPVIDQKAKVDLALKAYGLVNTAANRDDIGKLAQLRPDELRSAVELILGLQRLATAGASRKP